MLDLAPTGLAVLSARGQVLQINAAGLELLGGDASRILGAPFDRLLAPEAAPVWGGRMDQLRSTGRSAPLEVCLRPPGGRRLPVRLLARRHCAAGDEVWLASITPCDAEPRGGPEGGQAFAQDVLDALPSQVAVVDGRGVIIAVNQAWRRFAEDNGAPGAVRDGVGLDYLAACRGPRGGPDDEAHGAAEGIRAVLEGRRPLFTLEYPCHSPDEHRWFLLTASPLSMPDGGAVIAHIDITDRKLAQQQARERQQALARIARLNTVGALSSALAHEIAQPLTAIGHFNYAALTLLGNGGADPDEVRALLHQTEEQVDRAAAIVRRLKEFIRHGTLRRERDDVRRAAADAVELVGHLAATREVRILLRCPEQPVEAWIDRIQITQVIVNLLCNSIEAIDEGGAAEREIDVRMTMDEGEIRVTVSDSGPGLDPDWGDRIFDVFETRKSSGAGIGLAVGRSIAEAHGGRLWAEPAPPRGAVFQLTLPARG